MRPQKLNRICRALSYYIVEARNLWKDIFRLWAALYQYSWAPGAISRWGCTNIQAIIQNTSGVMIRGLLCILWCGTVRLTMSCNMVVDIYVGTCSQTVNIQILLTFLDSNRRNYHSQSDAHEIASHRISISYSSYINVKRCAITVGFGQISGRNRLR